MESYTENNTFHTHATEASEDKHVRTDDGVLTELVLSPQPAAGEACQ